MTEAAPIQAHLQRLKQALDTHRKGLEELESALLEFEEALIGESSVRPESRSELELLSIPEVCQNLDMGKSWVYRKIKSGELPSVKLGRSIKVKCKDLEDYLESHSYGPVSEER